MNDQDDDRLYQQHLRARLRQRPQGAVAQGTPHVSPADVTSEGAAVDPDLRPRAPASGRTSGRGCDTGASDR